jgi:hypothetical protein
VRRAIDDAASALRAEIPAFTRKNLLHAVRRSLGAPVSDTDFDLALAKRLTKGPLPGLLPARSRWRPRSITREWDAYFPKAVLLVDRPAILDLFVASGSIATTRLAVVCLDGSPAPVVSWLKRGFKAGRKVPFVYLHDAATVVYPFTLEPLASLIAHRRDEALVYRDLGLPPLGANARRFDDPALPEGEPILELEALPPATLVRFGALSAQRLMPIDPNMLPLTHDIDRRHVEGRRPEQARP